MSLILSRESSLQMVTFSTLERMTEVAVPGKELTNHYTDQQQTSLKEALCSSQNTTVGM